MKIFNRVFENKTFIRKSPKAIDDRYGCYFITGRQGTFKTYYSIVLADKQDRKLVRYVQRVNIRFHIPN